LGCKLQSISVSIEAVCRKTLQDVNRDSGAKPCPQIAVKNYMSYKSHGRGGGVGCGLGLLLPLGVGVGLGVTVVVGVGVDVTVAVAVAVAVVVAVGVGVAVGVTVAVAVAVGVAVAVAVGVTVGVTVAVAVAVGLGVGVTLGVGVGPPVTSRNAALIGPQVWKPWKSLTPRPRTKITWRPTDRLAVFMVASTATVGELNVPFIGMAVPPAQGGVSM
jgi:hypothetical protein